MKGLSAKDCGMLNSLKPRLSAQSFFILRSKQWIRCLLFSKQLPRLDPHASDSSWLDSTDWSDWNALKCASSRGMDSGQSHGKALSKGLRQREKSDCKNVRFLSLVFSKPRLEQADSFFLISVWRGSRKACDPTDFSWFKIPKLAGKILTCRVL